MLYLTQTGKRVHASIDGIKTICGRKISSKANQNTDLKFHCKHCSKKAQMFTCDKRPPLCRFEWEVIGVLERCKDDFNQGLPLALGSAPAERQAARYLFSGPDADDFWTKTNIDRAIAEATAGL
jgi:hypothetical protein